MITERLKVAFTGSAGFLGQAIIKPFENDYNLRLCDVRDFDSPHEKMIGDVSDFSFCQKLVDGADMLVIAHMMSQPYPDDPSDAFRVNVTGTANLFHAAAQSGIRRACLVSSWSVLGEEIDPCADYLGLPPAGHSIYSSTKACQEIIAQAIHNQYGMKIAVLRAGYVVDLVNMVDKYGSHFSERNGGMADREDIGAVARKCLELPELSYKAMVVTSLPAAPNEFPCGLETCKLLNWRSRLLECDPSQITPVAELV